MFLSLVFPCFNEEKAIDAVLPKALSLKKQLLKQNKLKKMEIIVVDDGSKDQSLNKINLYEKDIVILKLKEKKGYGFAIKSAFESSQADWMAFCDLDDSYEPKDLELLIDLLKKKNCPIVWGNRLNKNSQISLIRAGGNFLYQWLFWLLTFKKITDPCSGLRILKKERFWPDLKKLPDDLSFSLALSSYCLRFRIPFHSLDIHYNKRRGDSKLLVLKDGWRFLYQMIKYLFFKKF